MIDHKTQIHGNWRHMKPTPRECKGYEPPPSKGDWWVIVGCIALLALYVVFAGCDSRSTEQQMLENAQAQAALIEHLVICLDGHQYYHMAGKWLAPKYAKDGIRVEDC